MVINSPRNAISSGRAYPPPPVLELFSRAAVRGGAAATSRFRTHAKEIEIVFNQDDMHSCLTTTFSVGQGPDCDMDVLTHKTIRHLRQ